MTISAMARNVGGLAIDGCIRDSEEITKMGFPVFCRGFCIWGTTRALLGLINHPIFFGGVLVHPGDLILGDDDGMVVVERKQCESVLEKAIKRKEAEEKKADQLRAGGSMDISPLTVRDLRMLGWSIVRIPEIMESKGSILIGWCSKRPR